MSTLKTTYIWARCHIRWLVRTQLGIHKWMRFLPFRKTWTYIFLVMHMKKESAFQAALIRKLMLCPFVIRVVKNDANYIQGFPDLTVYLSNGAWAVLECKREERASRQNNQEYYIRLFDRYGFARFVQPENEEEVLRDLCQYASGTYRETCDIQPEQA